MIGVMTGSDMWKSALQSLFVLFLFLLQVWVGLTDSHVDQPPKLLVISFDGFRWDYLQKAKLPNMQRMIQNGAWSTKGLKNCFITKTAPNHYSLLSGLYEESHGIVGNVFFDPVLNKTYHIWIAEEQTDPQFYVDSGEPIWVTNERQSTEHRSGNIMWPGASTTIKGFQEYKSVLYDESVTLRQRMDLIIEWFTDEYPINLGLLYFNEPDETGHQHGPDSPEIVKLIETLDSDLGYLFEMLEQHKLLSNMNIILTSDHGMTTTIDDEEHRIDLNKFIDIDSYTIHTKSPIAAILPNTKELGEEIYRNLSNIPYTQVYKKEDIPKDYHYSNNRRIDPILLVPEEHYWVVYNESAAIAGNHGYNNSLSSMHPIFIAMGPSFKKGARVEQIRTVDVYEVMCAVLGLKPAPNNGSLEIAQFLLKNGGEADTGTFGIYMFILIFTGFISGIFGVAACRVHRQYKRRSVKIRSVPELFAQAPYSKMEEDSVPLMSENSDDEL